MLKITYRTPVYQTSEWLQARLIKNGKSRLVYIGIPSYTWKESFENYAGDRGFTVRWI